MLDLAETSHHTRPYSTYLPPLSLFGNEFENLSYNSGHGCALENLPPSQRGRCIIFKLCAGDYSSLQLSSLLLSFLTKPHEIMRQLLILLLRRLTSAHLSGSFSPIFSLPLFHCRFCVCVLPLFFVFYFCLRLGSLPTLYSTSLPQTSQDFIVGEPA